ncbi:MAG: hypothetical protein US68_C0027G0008 [Candidatus Shapirobacteria bacterium GW2011_GWE1_38_10]|uniref:Uncharacterized protein n=1 Tax=Candidatus Shapirobacteria bacterium GW2011_GWE1_38_10 TaxID=1618488 RepID=A0A0G0HZX7_9BACT|nr:MAG: hypothetical protein US68_C0027G0008 [Candidatus Shapirobacteria bacterium GW2011_GWE1_38_10]
MSLKITFLKLKITIKNVSSQFILILTALFFLFMSPHTIQAQTCVELGGDMCVSISDCSDYEGVYIPGADDCTSPEICCNLTLTCTELGGDMCLSSSECTDSGGTYISGADDCSTYEICCNLPVSPCGGETEPCCPGDVCDPGYDCANLANGLSRCMTDSTKDCSESYCDDPLLPYGYCGVDDYSTTYEGWGCDNSGDDCDSATETSCADCWCCPGFHTHYVLGEVDYCSVPTVGPAATAVPRPGLTIQGDCPAGSIDTAIGCLPVSDKNAFLSFILRWAIGIAGGVSFILIASSGFMIITAAGDKRKLQGGKELLTAAVSGLFLIIFSVFILDLIGIRILRIPGL